MPPRVFQTLVILVEASPRMVSKAQLFRALWPDTSVDESGLAQNIHLLRKILGPRPEGGEYIETVPKRGYRLAAEITRDYRGSGPVWKKWWPALVALAVLALAGTVALRPRLKPAAHDREAVRLVEMGRETWRNTLVATPAAESEFQRAIQLDPNYAPAYVGLATIEATGGVENAGETDRLLAKALLIDPDSADAHATAAFAAMIHRWDWERARTEFQRAIALDPRNTGARRWYSMYLSFRGEHAAAAEQLRTALEIEPGSASLLMQRCSQLSYEDDFDAAIESCRAALQVQPRFHLAHARLFQIYGTLGKAELAARHFVLAMDASDVQSEVDSEPRIELAARTRGMPGLLEDLQKGSAYARTQAAGMLRDRAATLNGLQQLVAEHGFFSAFIRAEPMFHFLYGDAEFNALLRKIGLPATAR